MQLEIGNTIEEKLVAVCPNQPKSYMLHGSYIDQNRVGSNYVVVTIFMFPQTI
uniref:Uncharacterized protein n=1 Tax=Arundo donax TaxID=35708 RepID=A0A0A9G543_ARUDO